jgi:hypothetical protein
MLFDMDLAYCNERLAQAGVRFEEGLTGAEIAAVEKEFGFLFPPDLREFLSHALPVSVGWLDWRHEKRSEIKRRLEWPYEGICFDIQHNGFWLNSWGPKPATLLEAFAVARAAVDSAPRLIPIYSHRYLPDRPDEVGNPVLSVYQTDVIYYGANLLDYFCNQFPNQFGRTEFAIDGPIRRIEFWLEIADA